MDEAQNFKRKCSKDGNNFAIHEWTVDASKPTMQIIGNQYVFNTQYLGKMMLQCSPKFSIESYLQAKFLGTKNPTNEMQKNL